MAVRRSGTVGIAGQQFGFPSTSPDVRPDVANFRVPFDRDKFTQLITIHGYDVVWEKGAECPNLKGPNPKDHDINCKLCHNGVLYFDPKPTRMLITSLNLSQQFYAYGRLDSGKAQISAFPEFKVSFWDRITLCHSRVRFTELVKRQRSDVYDRPRYNPLCVVHCVWADNQTLVTAKERVDFDITEQGQIRWLTLNRPNADTFYSIVYFHQPMYIVLDTLHNVRDLNTIAKAEEVQQHEFPVQVMAQLDQFVRDEGEDPSNESEAKNPFATKGSSFIQGA